MSDRKEDALHHKYDPLPEDPRHRKRARKVNVRSDHKHVYEEVAVDAHTKVFRDGRKIPYLYVATRCKVCGRVGDFCMRADLQEPPAGMRLYELAGILEMLDAKVLTDEMEVGGDDNQG